MSEDQNNSSGARKLPDRTAKDSPKPTTPYTPASRFISSNYSSPGSTFGKEEDAIILELNTRFIQAGVEGESSPQCRIAFTPQSARRVGDYRSWMPGYEKKQESLETWGNGHELWRSDLNDVDLGLVEDKLERVVREVYNKYLLLDAGNARLVIVVPSLLPHPILSTILRKLFERWNYSTITLLSAPAMAVAGAGLRSGLVVDVGWEETTVTSIYEFREVGSLRTTRAMKMFTKSFAEYLFKVSEGGDGSGGFHYDLEAVEDILCRIAAYVKPSDDHAEETSRISKPALIDIPTPGTTRTFQLDASELSSLIAETFVSQDGNSYPDDHEIPVDQVMFQALLSLPTDVRSICVSRIVFTGAGAEISLIPIRILQKLKDLLHERGWNKVSGKNVNGARDGVSGLSHTRRVPSDARHDQPITTEKELLEERYLREKTKSTQTDIKGVIRQVNSVGPWAGASLLTSLKIKGLVEVQRDRFLSQGLSSASRDAEISVIPQQRTGGLAMRSKGAGERTSWTLAGWA